MNPMEQLVAQWTLDAEREHPDETSEFRSELIMRKAKEFDEKVKVQQMFRTLRICGALVATGILGAWMMFQ